MSIIETVMAYAAARSLWLGSSWRGRWRVQRWAERHPRAYAAFAPRRVRMPGFDFDVDARASLDVFLNGITASSAIERTIRRYVRAGDNVVDIGANLGWTARLMSALVGASGQVHAFEPMPAAFANLRRNADIAPLRNIHAYDVAASDAEGEVEIFVASDSATALASMRRPGDAAPGRGTRVRTVTVDGWLDRLPRIAFVKIDVEGAELKVLRGMERLLARDRPVLAIELSDAWLRELGDSGQSLIDFLETRGWAVHAVDGDVLTRLRQAPPHQVDVVCLPEPPPR